ncbi:MAG: nitroreductase family protein, partial [Peptococcaceae bacterium]|nr:nitroreductase family protein [Peptococcaceae bacterium]
MILIDKERCVGCGLCAADCITVNLQLVNGKAEVKGGCLECGHCVAICPQNAVSIPEFDMADVSACRMELDADVLLQAIKGRRSIRNYQAKKVEKDKLHLLAEAGRYTATAKNTQGCRFVLVQDELDTFKDMIW